MSNKRRGSYILSHSTTSGSAGNHAYNRIASRVVAPRAFVLRDTSVPGPEGGQRNTNTLDSVVEQSQKQNSEVRIVHRIDNGMTDEISPATT